ncbi:DUF3800 domain-containing protein [Candidatus Poribacteria bacterium]|nr:DUF3800 domain-containing protein [Candidatus Poribacteria bacterium]
MQSKKIYNIYCDESCHLENDHQRIMVLGAVWCPINRVKDISDKLKSIKLEHNLNKYFELKWTKVSPSKIDYYLNVIEYFFNENDLHFRALIIDKTTLKHQEFNQDHNMWYYKMFFHLLDAIFSPHNSSYRIYLDVKDTCSSQKVKKLHEVLCNKNYDFSRDIIERVQTIRSHEVEILQLTDLLIGAISYISNDWNLYLDKIYEFYKKDFIDNKPIFKGVKVSVKRLPFDKGKESNFWHIISEGTNETDRTPDLRRCERIRWPKPIIEHNNETIMKLWENERHSNKGIERNICIWFESAEYIVILRKRKNIFYFGLHILLQKNILREN